MLLNTSKKTDPKFLLTLFSIFLSNVTFATYSIFNVIFAVIAAYYYLSQKGKFDGLFYIIIVLLLLIGLGQAFEFQTFNYYNFGGIFLIFLIPYFAYRAIGLIYFKYFVQIIYKLSLISLVFWISINLIPGLGESLKGVSKLLHLDPESNESLIIYNVELNRSTFGFIKNAGFTAEGGLFCTFIIPALFFNSINGEYFSKKNLVFIIAIITTASTAGYSALLFFILFAIISLKNKIYTILLLPFIIFLAFYSVTELPFMYEKVTKSYNDEMNVYNTTKNPARKGRFLSARVDLDIIKEYPLTGRGIYNEIRYLNDEEREIGYSNSYLGIVGLASRYGLILWTLYMFLLITFLYKTNSLYLNKKKSNKLYPFFFLLAIFSIAMGQNPFYLVIYLCMVYAGYDYKTKKITLQHHTNK